MQTTGTALPPVCDTPQVRRDPIRIGENASRQAKAQTSSAWKPTW